MPDTPDPAVDHAAELIRPPQVSILTRRRSRRRPAYLLAVVVCIVLGLGSRHGPSGIPALFGKYPGDALWAAMVFFGFGIFRPRTSTLNIALLTFAFCLIIEFLKLYQAPWIVGIRHTTVGHLVFGHVFSASNLVAYAIGIAVAVGVEVLWPYGSRETSATTAPDKPRYVHRMRHVLFICGRNQWRGPTAEQLFAEVPGIETASAGLGNDAATPVPGPAWCPNRPTGSRLLRSGPVRRSKRSRRSAKRRAWMRGARSR